MAWEIGDSERLSYQEVRDVLSQMSAADWKRAEAIAGFLGHRLAGMTGEDLLEEICTQLLEGRRRFPRGPAPLVVLKTAMRSEASNVRKSGRASPIDARYRIDNSEESDDARPMADAPDRRSPEVELLAREHLERLCRQCAGDSHEELVVLSWADGLRGAEAREATGLNAKDFDAARKRVMRRLVGSRADKGGS